MASNVSRLYLILNFTKTNYRIILYSCGFQIPLDLPMDHQCVPYENKNMLGWVNAMHDC